MKTIKKQLVIFCFLISNASTLLSQKLEFEIPDQFSAADLLIKKCALTTAGAACTIVGTQLLKAGIKDLVQGENKGKKRRGLKLTLFSSALIGASIKAIHSIFKHKKKTT